jgi:DNA-directed RNA polymerase specialized sigma24 family protein
MSSPDWPDAATCANLHRRLAAGDPTATADFAAALLDPLVAYLWAGHPGTDDHLFYDAAIEALLSVMRNPAVYHPERAELPAFLRMAAKGDLLNLLAKERRHQDRREPADCVELEAVAGNSPPEDDDLPSFDAPQFAPVIAALSEADRRVLDLMRAGERRTEAFAAVLGVTGLSAGEQQREVKRVKERIFKRLKRAGGGRERGT